ncbi:MAG TPA: hypothetical protein PKB10_04115 [Tepidisphaeraceae bacterium]|nr:hypothetical protein [Tepidisphaeraceae bacterium]
MARTGWTTGLILTLLIGGARAEEKIDAPTTAPATAPTPAPSTQPVEAPVSPDVQKIIERLGGDGFRDRQRAEDELVAMGLDVLPQLRRAAGEARDDEVRSRLESAIARIDQESQFGASLITMKFTDAPAKDAFEELFRQAGATLRVEPEGHLDREQIGKVTIDVERRPFWQVIAELSRQTNMDLQSGGQAGLVLRPGGARAADQPIVYSGPVMIRAESATRTNTIQFSQAGVASKSFIVQFIALLEPKLSGGAPNATSVKIESMLDASGQPVENNPQASNIWGGHGGQVSFMIRLPTDKDLGGKLSLVRGVLSVPVTTKFETLEIDKLEDIDNTTHALGPLRVEIKSLAKENDRTHKLTITVHRDTATDDIWRQVNHQMFGQIRLLDANDNEYNTGGWGSSGDGSKLEGNVTFNRMNRRGGAEPGEPAKLRWRVGVEGHTIDVPFEFKALPMP